jgi:formate hydrogenlyase subunit 6/NADH:ubiquinone oxidoreductase subunit I
MARRLVRPDVRSGNGRRKLHRLPPVRVHLPVGATFCDHFVLDYQACMQCELCIQVCPTDAIVMTRALAPTSTTRDGLLLTKERLMANGQTLLASPKLASDATPTKIREWTDAARGLPKPEDAG